MLGLGIQHQMEGLLCTGSWPQTLMDVSKDIPHPHLHCDQACSSARSHAPSPQGDDDCPDHKIEFKGQVVSH